VDRPVKNQRTRRAILLGCLALAVAALVAARVVPLLESSDAATSAGVPAACKRPTPPSLVHVGPAHLLELRDRLYAVVAPLGGYRDVEGNVTPADAWGDNPPPPFRLSHLGHGLWPGSYEIRRYAANGDHIGADVFLFAGPGPARTFFEQASSTRCHRAAQTPAVIRLPDARNLTWVNPVGATQEDVWLVRGPRVYRIVDVLSRRPWRSLPEQRRIGVARVEALACLLADADCAIGRAS
jgi:hypothetical protein